MKNCRGHTSVSTSIIISGQDSRYRALGSSVYFLNGVYGAIGFTEIGCRFTLFP